MSPITKMLMEIALLGTLYDEDELVDRIRSVLVELGVNELNFDLTRAVLMLSRGAPEMCAQTLEERVLAKEPFHEIGRAMLSVAWRQVNRSDWRGLAESLLATSSDPTARSVAYRELAAA
jgi:Bacterial type III secretion protein (HrpB1_HrpK)